MSKLRENLRLIVGIKDLENKVDQVAELAAIGANTGIAYQSFKAGIGTGSATEGGLDSGDLNSEAGSKGAGSGSIALGGGATSGQPESKTADEVIDKNQKVGATLDKLEVKDCETGKKIIIGETGQFTPPPNWISGNKPPDSNWRQGYMWNDASTPGGYVSTPSQAAQIIFEVNYGGGAPIGGGDVYAMEGGVFNVITAGGSAQASQKFVQTVSAGVPIPTPVPFSTNFSGLACVPGSSGACPINNPGYIPSWPVKDEFQLIRKNGRLVGNPNDPNVPAKYKDGKQSKLDFCFLDGGRTGTQENLVDGGFMIYETDGSGNPTGNAKLYNSNSQFVRSIPADQVAAWSAANGVDAND